MTAAAQLGQIFYTIVLPILLLAGVGWLLQRKAGLEMRTMTRLNFFLVVPGLIYASVVDPKADVRAADVLTIVGFSAAMLAALAATTYVVAALRRVPRDRRSAMLMTTMFYNSGNYGLPLQDLAFRSVERSQWASTRQVFVILTQNLVNFTVGILLAAVGGRRGRLRQNLLVMAKFPPIYALAAALVTVQLRAWIGDDSGVAAAVRPFWQVIQYVRGAFIAVALVTLGAQLGTLRRGGARYPVTASVLIRLLGGPALGLGLIYLLGLKGLMAQLLLISTSTPTAVNCMLLCLQFDNHPDFAARSVFYSTLLSPVTVTLTIFLAQGGLLARFAT